MKILSIGNSFSQDTMEHLPKIAEDLGHESVFGQLYIGGCPIDYHYLNAKDELPVYRYYINTGDGWTDRKNIRISEAILGHKWDWINIQHGSKDGRCYTEEIHYRYLPELVAYVKRLAGDDTKISFNMTWVADPEQQHHEMVRLYDNDPEKMFAAVVNITRNHVSATKGIDRISPVGTAIQYARRAGIPEMTRDYYHVSYGIGRYIAALTFLKALTDVDITKLCWAPEGVDEKSRKLAISIALKACENPYDL